MSALLQVHYWDDILPAYRNTAVTDLLAYHNLSAPHRSHDRVKLLIGMCMDNRIALPIPDKFAYVLRAGGAILRRIELKVSRAVAVGGVVANCLTGHNQCGMAGLRARRDVFVAGLVENGGWARREAERHFHLFSALFEIREPVEFVVAQAQRLRERYPRVMVAPLFYQVGEGLLCRITEGVGC